MRKLAFIILLSSSLACQAQLEKGQKIFGGSFLISTKDLTNTISSLDRKNLSFSVNPNIQFINDRNTITGFGINAMYASAAITDTGLTISKNAQMGIGLNGFYQKQVWLGSRVFVYAAASPYIHYSWIHGKPNNEKVGASNGYAIVGGISISPGIGFCITKKLLVEVSFNKLADLSYAWSRNNPGDYLPAESQKQFTGTTNFNQNLFTNLGIGFKWLIKSY